MGGVLMLMIIDCAPLLSGKQTPQKYDTRFTKEACYRSEGWRGGERGGELIGNGWKKKEFGALELHNPGSIGENFFAVTVDMCSMGLLVIIAWKVEQEQY